MDFDNVKTEKAKAMLRYNRFRRIGRCFRAAEVCVAILFVFWTFSRLPLVIQLSGEFIRRIAGVISTHLFVFLLGNSIVVLLLTKSSDHTTAESEIYKAFVGSLEDRSKPSSDEVLTEEIVYDDKQVILTHSNSNSNSNLTDIDEDCDNYEELLEIELDSVRDERKIYGRSKSDVTEKQSVIMRRSLKRSETQTDNNITNNYAEDNLSNEEFKKTIEAFIAKQLMFRRQESLAVVLLN